MNAPLTRRAALAGAIAVPAAAVTVGAAPAAPDPHARLAAAIAEMKAAAMAVDPTITRWSTAVAEDGDLTCSFMLAGLRGDAR